MGLINFRLGAKGKKVDASEVTLSSGTGTVSTDLSKIEYCIITQKDATAVADGVSWTASGGTITVDSSNGSSAETYSVISFGW
ncbi:hypothetical protein N9878_01200 [bacterium]|nr:hypothetical protein [bacterium]